MTDPFGLHPHYFTDGDPFSRLAPSPAYLSQGRDHDPLAASLLRRRHHLFGSRTLYEGVERLPPGAIVTPGRTIPYFDYTATTGDLPDVPDLLSREFAAFDGIPTVLPLTGGLDSRLVLASVDVDYGYTFGRADTWDRPVARRFAGFLREYDEFSLLDHPYPKEIRAAVMRIFDGTCDAPFAEIVPAYQRLATNWGGGHVLIDGYTKDVFQRATYLTHGGLRGSLAKLLPILTMRNFDPIVFLCRRHPLPDAEFSLIREPFERFVEPLALDAARKLLLFELVHGRGSRYTLNGGTILGGQFFIPVQAFYL